MKLLTLLNLGAAFTNGQMFKKVKLKDVDTLTLYNGKMTNGRRSAPVPQLQCRGGSAGCHMFVPEVVQCYNRGSDGLDTQWECKTEMDNAYKFGKIQVSCEGYDYADDPYILAGSCGLEYTIERTNAGVGGGGSDGWSGGYSSNGWNGGKSYTDSGSDSLGVIVFICIVGFILFKVVSSHAENGERQHPTNPNYIPPAGTAPPPYAGAEPPPYTPGSSTSNNTGGGSNWSWTSFGAGWLGSSFFNSGGTRNRRHHHSGWSNDTHRRSPSPPRRKSSPSSSGTRTASGFGGTSRR